MNILLAEDETFVQGFVCACLHKMGHTTSSVQCIREFKSLIISNQYDLILADVKLIGGDSSKIYEYYSTSVYNPEIIYMTGDSNFKDENHLVLYKPFTMKELSEAIYNSAGT